MESPENVHILWWLIGFSYFIHLLAAIVAIWDRLRLKPGVIERLSGFVDWTQYNKNQAEADTRLDACATKIEVSRLSDQVSARIDGLHRSMKEDQKTTQQVLRDILKELGQIQGQVSRGAT